MVQAKDYVTMLERINAVGMSVQILETLGEDNRDFKNQTTAEIARQLLSMYSARPLSAKSSPKPKAKAKQAE